MAALPQQFGKPMDAFNIASTNGVRTTLAALEKKGYIRRRPMVSRGIELTDYVERDIPGVTESREVPVIGRWLAGEPVLATENVESTVAVDRSFLPSEDVFLTTASTARACEMRAFSTVTTCWRGSRKRRSPGEIVVAVIGEEATVKRYFPEAGG